MKSVISWHKAGAIVLLSGVIAQTASAADKELLDILLANGAINQTQYEQLLEKETIEKADVDQVVTSLDHKGLNVKSSDGDYSISIGARLHAEVSSHSGDLPAGFEPVDGSELRRARVQTKGKFAGNWSWAAEVDFADNKTSIKDFWLGYTTDSGTRLTFGHQKQPFNLGLEMSSNDLPFIERPIDNFLVAPFADRAIGFRAERSGRNWFTAAGLFGESVGSGSSTDDESWGVAGRFVYAPILNDDQVLHLGVRGLYREPSEASPSYRLRDETTHMSNLRIVDTGTIDDIDSVRLSGVEAAWAAGRFSVIGEYNALDMKRDGLTDLDFAGWDLTGRWAITGESYSETYKLSSGEFKRLKPANAFSPATGGWGAWEFALRYADVDLNDADILGGEESVLTSGLNWYPNETIRFMLEWSRIVDTDGSSELREVADGLNIFQFRTQYTF